MAKKTKLPVPDDPEQPPTENPNTATSDPAPKGKRRKDNSKDDGTDEYGVSRITWKTLLVGLPALPKFRFQSFWANSKDTLSELYDAAKHIRWQAHAARAYETVTRLFIWLVVETALKLWKLDWRTVGSSTITSIASTITWLFVVALKSSLLVAKLSGEIDRDTAGLKVSLLRAVSV
jgi:hypothetical protein